MALPSSGVITMAQVATELGVSQTGINLDQANVRSLAGRPSGAISMSDLHGKAKLSFTYTTQAFLSGSEEPAYSHQFFYFTVTGGSVSSAVPIYASAGYTLSHWKTTVSGNNVKVYRDHIGITGSYVYIDVRVTFSDGSTTVVRTVNGKWD